MEESNTKQKCGKVDNTILMELVLQYNMRKKPLIRSGMYSL